MVPRAGRTKGDLALNRVSGVLEKEGQCFFSATTTISLLSAALHCHSPALRPISTLKSLFEYQCLVRLSEIQ